MTLVIFNVNNSKRKAFPSDITTFESKNRHNSLQLASLKLGDQQFEISK